MPNDTWPEWERVLSAAAHLQRILPEAVLVGGTASALYAKHRLSTDADHVLADLLPPKCGSSSADIAVSLE
jgi:hypothetical protein